MRLFIALTLPDDALDALTALQSVLPSGRPVPEEQLHLTLAFLGEQDVRSIEACHDALATLNASAITLTLAQPALFGGQHGRALALSADGGPALTELHDRIRSRLHGAGLAPERRRFRPHVTLARLKGKTDPAPAFEALSGQTLGPFTATSFGLIESTLRPDGAQHDILAQYPLVERMG